MLKFDRSQKLWMRLMIVKLALFLIIFEYLSFPVVCPRSNLGNLLHSTADGPGDTSSGTSSDDQLTALTLATGNYYIKHHDRPAGDGESFGGCDRGAGSGQSHSGYNGLLEINTHLGDNEGLSSQPDYATPHEVPSSSSNQPTPDIIDSIDYYRSFKLKHGITSCLRSTFQRSDALYSAIEKLAPPEVESLGPRLAEIKRRFVDGIKHKPYREAIDHAIIATLVRIRLIHELYEPVLFVCLPEAQKCAYKALEPFLRGLLSASRGPVPRLGKDWAVKLPIHEQARRYFPTIKNVNRGQQNTLGWIATTYCLKGLMPESIYDSIRRIPVKLLTADTIDTEFSYDVFHGDFKRCVGDISLARAGLGGIDLKILNLRLRKVEKS